MLLKQEKTKLILKFKFRSRIIIADMIFLSTNFIKKKNG